MALRPTGKVSVTATHCALAPGVTVNVTTGAAEEFPLTLRVTCALAGEDGGLRDSLTRWNYVAVKSSAGAGQR